MRQQGVGELVSTCPVTGGGHSAATAACCHVARGPGAPFFQRHWESIFPCETPEFKKAGISFKNVFKCEAQMITPVTGQTGFTKGQEGRGAVTRNWTHCEPGAGGGALLNPVGPGFMSPLAARKAGAERGSELPSTHSEWLEAPGSKAVCPGPAQLHTKAALEQAESGWLTRHTPVSVSEAGGGPSGVTCRVVPLGGI